MSTKHPHFDKAVWLRHPALEADNSRLAEVWMERAANDRVFSFKLWKNHPKDMSDHQYAMDKLRAMKPAPFFRKGFVVKKPIAGATVYFCGLGLGELHLNGEACGDFVLSPRQTQYEKRALYLEYDVLNQIKEGDNVLAVALGQGWFSENLAFGNDFHDDTVEDVRRRMDAVHLEGNKDAELSLLPDTPWTYGDPGFILQLVIDYEDGSQESISSDSSWRCGTGAILKNSLFSGELFDARKHDPAWTSIDYDDSSWTEAAEQSEPLSPRLELMRMPPERPFREFNPVDITEPEPGVYVFHFERVFAGWQRLRVQAEAGTLISLRWGSQLDEQGQVNSVADGQETAGAKLIDGYIARGEGTESWEPRFTYHCGRYIEVRGLSEKPSLDLLTGIAIATDSTHVGEFSCDHELLNRIHDALTFTLKSNTHGTINAMSSRERDQWPVQGILNGRNLMFHFDMREIWRETIRDWQGNTNQEGLPYDITPSRRRFGPMSYTLFGMPILLRDYHAFYNDKEVLQENFAMVELGLHKALEVFAIKPGSHLVVGLGDHCDPDFGGGTIPGNVGMAHNSPSTLIASMQFADACRVTAEIAKAIGRDPNKLMQIHEAICHDIVAEYYDQGASTFGSMAGNALAVHHGIAPQDEVEAILDTIESEIMSRQGAFTTGFFGTPALLFALADNGRANVACALMTRREFPSYGYYMKNFDAHEIWEYWDRSFPGHPPFGGRMQMEKGGAVEWTWRCLGGLRPDFSSPGLEHVTLQPSFPDGIQQTSIAHQAPQGTISSAWQRKGEALLWEVQVPRGSRATLKIHTREAVEFSDESKKHFEKSPNGFWTRQVSGGTHRIQLLAKSPLLTNQQP